MKKKNAFQRYMLRPIIYMTAFRLMLSAIFLSAFVQFVKNAPGAYMAAGFLAALFALLAYLVYLRRDGIRIPRVKNLKSKFKKNSARDFGGFADHVNDDPPVTYDDLEDDEKDFCSFAANLICMLVFGALSFAL